MSDQIYANGRIAVMSNRLLGPDRFLRLAECVTVTEALKVLSESGFGLGVAVENPNDYEKLLIAELDNAMSLLKELCCDKNAVAYFTCRYNYHNAKVLLKRKYMRDESIENCFEGTDISAEEMQKAFINDDYSLCTKNMAEACDSVDMAFASGNRSPQVVDVTLDKAMFADMHKYASRSTALIRKLFDWEINTINLMLVYRLKKAALGVESLEQWFVDGASVKKATVQKLWETDDAKSVLPNEYANFYKLCTSNNVNLAAAEAAQKAGRNSLIKQYADPLSIQPAVQYFYNKVDEIDKVRIIIISIKNGVDKDQIKSRIKL